jgi:hypothetical protein
MTPWLRRAGHGLDPVGAQVVWSVSEGGRGRRWREARIAPDGSMLSSLLLETDPAGRFLHTELTMRGTLLTLHPEGDGTMHGNVISTDGVEHVIGIPWQPDGLLLIDGSAIAHAAAAHLLRPAVPASSSVICHAVVIDGQRLPSAEQVRVERIEDDTWRFGPGEPFHVSAHGLPALAEAEDWPLEVE